MKYPATCTAQGACFVITFRDLPEATAEARDADEALSKACSLLRETMNEYSCKDRIIPMPSAQQEGERLVTLPLSTSAKVLLVNTMLAQGVTPADLGRRMGATRQEVHRLTDLTHTTTIDRIEDAMAALGWEMNVVCKPAWK